MNGRGQTLTQSAARLIPYLLFFLTLAVYLRVGFHDFINFDDDVFVYDNPVVSRGLTPEGIVWAFTTPHEANWIPLSFISHMLDVTLFGMSPGGHHLVNLLFHLGSTLLLFLLLNRTTGRPFRSGMVAALFALHPLHVESVAWIAERKDVLSLFLGMVALHCHERYVRKGGWWYLALVGAFAASLLAKPMMVTLPVVMLLLEWWPLGRFEREGEGRRRIILRGCLEKIPLLALSLGAGIMTILAQRGGGELSQGYTLAARLGRSAIATLTYLKKMVLPTDLAVIYPFSKYPPTIMTVLSASGAVLILTLLALLVARRIPYLATGWFWYLVTLLPVSGIIQIGQHEVADRYTYLPLTGIFIAAVWGAGDLAERLKIPGRVTMAAGGVLIAVMGVLTSLQLRHWKDGEAAMSRAVAVSPGNWVALNNLGLIRLKQGRVDEAIRLFRESISAKPTYSLAHLNLGVAFMSLERYGEARETLEWARRFDPYNPKIRLALGTVYHWTGEELLAQRELLAIPPGPEAETLRSVMNTPPPAR